MLTYLKIGGHQNLWTGKMLSIEMAVEVQILQQILQDLQVILQKMILRYSLWQYGLWSFQTGDKKLERFLPNNQHNIRKLLNFEFGLMASCQKVQNHPTS